MLLYYTCASSQSTQRAQQEILKSTLASSRLLPPHPQDLPAVQNGLRLIASQAMKIPRFDVWQRNYHKSGAVWQGQVVNILAVSAVIWQPFSDAAALSNKVKLTIGQLEPNGRRERSGFPFERPLPPSPSLLFLSVRPFSVRLSLVLQYLARERPSAVCVNG